MNDLTDIDLLNITEMFCYSRPLPKIRNNYSLEFLIIHMKIYEDQIFNTILISFLQPFSFNDLDKGTENELDLKVPPNP